MCRQNERTHKHHIIPRYKGGPDTKETLVEVTITQHAMFHFCNYQLWGNDEDKLAWKALSGQITLDEIKYEAMLLGGKRGNEVLKEKFKDPEYYASFIEKCKQGFENSSHKEKRKGGKKSASQRWMCTVTGYVCNAGPLTIYQRNRGIDVSNRVRLE